MGQACRKKSSCVGVACRGRSREAQGKSMITDTRRREEAMSHRLSSPGIRNGRQRPPALLCCLLLLSCLLTASCVESSLPDGAVASVNGKTITLRLVQALMDSRSVDMGSLEAGTPDIIKAQYGEALGTLIIACLAEEELAERGQSVSEESVRREEQIIREDYEGEDLNAYLEREALDYDDWRRLLRVHLTMQAFERQVLLPSIRISVDEVRAYHAAHAERFRVPDHMMLCFLSDEDKSRMEAYCRRFPTGRDNVPDGLRVQCLDMTEAELPQPERKEVAAIAEGRCGNIREVDGSFRAFGVVVRHKGGLQPAAAVYPFIEAALREQKLRAAFAAWLERRLAHADIRVAAALRPVLEDMARRSREREAAREGAAESTPAAREKAAPPAVPEATAPPDASAATKADGQSPEKTEEKRETAP